MKKKIESLTAAQKALFPAYAERWTNIGLSTAPADRPRAEAAIRAMYAQAKLKEPRIVWCGSTLAMALTRAAVWDSVRASVGASVWDSVRASVWDSVRASVWDSVGDSVRASVWDSVWDSVRDSVRDSVWDSVRASVGASVGASVRASVRDSVWDSVRDSVGDSVRASVRASVRDSVWDSVRDSVWDSVRDSVWDSGYGQHDAEWIGFFAYFREVLGLTGETAPLQPLTELCQSAGWFLPHREICWVAERHTVVHKDEGRQIHCEIGPAIAYPDGWEIYAIHGVLVPKSVVMEPEKISVADIDAEENIERRRIMIDRMGHGKYLQETGAKIIDMDTIPIGGEVAGSIVRALLRDKNGLVYLCGHDGSTERTYYMSVDPQSKTCGQAHESICGFKECLIIANS